MDVQLVPRDSVPFADPARSIGTLPADLAARVVAAAADVAFIIDADGVIVDHAVSVRELANDNFGNWVDRRWEDTVSRDSRGKIAELLAEADGGRAATRWRQVNHITSDGMNVAMRYIVVKAGNDRHRIAIGRDLRESASLQQRLLQAQQSMERDYVRLRQAESRYRLLFDLASEAVLILDSASYRVVEINAAAQRLLGVGADAAVGAPLEPLLAGASREAARAMLASVANGGAPVAVAVQLARGLSPATMSATLFRQDQSVFLLTRFNAASAGLADNDPRQMLLDVLERMPDAFVVTDEALNILAENSAFLELAQLPRREQARGIALDTLLGRPGIDLGLIVAHLREHRSVRNFMTIFRTPGGAEDEVEVSAVAVPDGDQPCFGFAIRMTARRLRPEAAAPGRDLPRSVEQLTELVGRVSLKDIVRESTDLIERLCIEAALTYTSDNRASAAEILGLSRQSLYSKLHRHGLGNLAGADD